MTPGYIDPEYVDVAERIRLFFEKYPDGRLQTDRPWLELAGDQLFICCMAHAYRTADDQTPSTGLAWEPVPGPTPFTRQSEAQNVQTSAWGRAIVAAGIPSKKIATQQDVQARQSEQAAPPDPEEAWKRRNRKMRAVLATLEKEQPREDGVDWTAFAKEISVGRWGKASTKDLTPQEHQALIDELDAYTVPFG